MFEVKATTDSSVQRELSQNHILIAKILIITGFLGLIGYLIYSIILDVTNIRLIILIGLIIGVGISILSMHNKGIKVIGNEKHLPTNLYEFSEDFVNITSLKNNEVIATSKTYYDEFVKFKETNNLFFLYPTLQLAYPIFKDQLNEEQKDFIRNIKTKIKKK